MKGLLYKDFIAIKGKVFIIFLLLGLFFAFISAIVLQSEEDLFLIPIILYDAISLAVVIFIIGFLANLLLSSDDAPKTKSYLLSLPTGNRTYIQEKYVFVGIVFYIFISYHTFFSMMIKAFCPMVHEPLLNQNTMLLNSVIYMLLFLMSIELPIYLRFGSRIAKELQNIFTMVLFFGLLIFVLFGNLTLLDRWGLEQILNWMNAHQAFLLLITTFEPLVVIGLYGLSYLISQKIVREEKCFHEL